MSTFDDTLMYDDLTIGLPKMTWRAADAWVTGGFEKSNLVKPAKIMRTIHAFNTLGYFSPSDRDETLRRMGQRFGVSWIEMLRFYEAYERHFPIQMEAVEEYPNSSTEAFNAVIDRNVLVDRNPNDIALVRAIERIEATKRDELWKASPSLAALAEGKLPTKPGDYDAEALKNILPGTSNFDEAALDNPLLTFDEAERRLRNLIDRRDEIGGKLEGLQQAADTMREFSVLDESDAKALARMEHMLESGELERAVLNSYQNGDIKMVTEDGTVVDGSRVVRVEIDRPDGPIESMKEQITIKAFMADGTEVTRVQPHTIPFAMSIPHFTCSYKGCGLRLNRYFHPERMHQGLGAYEWLHGRAFAGMGIPDHKPVPIPDEFQPARLICDFCTNLDPEWSLGCDDYDLLDPDSPKVRLVDRRWACCQRCKDLIDAGRMEDVTKLAFLSIIGEDDRRDPRLHEAMLSELTAMHQGFLQHRTGDDRLFADGAPL